MSLLSLAQLYFFNFKSKFFCIAVTKPKGYKIVSQKNVGLRKFWPNLEILEAIVIGLKVAFFGDFASWSLKFSQSQS